jgi:hypothetical protein
VYITVVQLEMLVYVTLQFPSVLMRGLVSGEVLRGLVTTAVVMSASTHAFPIP